jgi:hypothetical protein
MDWTGFQILDNNGNVIDGGTFGGSNSNSNLPQLPQLPSFGGTPNPAPQIYTPTASNPSGTANPTSATPASSPSSWSHWLARGTIIVLGFIFIAVGLAMFRTSQEIIKTTAKAAL